MQIAENVWQVGGLGLTAAEDAAIYLIRFDDAAALIDAGCGGGSRALFTNISKAIPAKAPITHLILTHCRFIFGTHITRGKMPLPQKIVGYRCPGARPSCAA